MRLSVDCNYRRDPPSKALTDLRRKSLRVELTERLLSDCGLISARHRREVEGVIRQRPVVQAMAPDEAARELGSAAWLSALSAVGQRPSPYARRQSGRYPCGEGLPPAAWRARHARQEEGLGSGGGWTGQRQVMCACGDDATPNSRQRGLDREAVAERSATQGARWSPRLGCFGRRFSRRAPR
jgi:hypothetical protein